MLERLADHPGLALATLAWAPQGEGTLALLENLLGLLLASGIPPQDAAWTADVLAMLVTHAAIEGEVRQSDEVLSAAVSATFEGLSPRRYPLIAANSAALVAGSSEDRFSFAVDVVLDGVLARR